MDPLLCQRDQFALPPDAHYINCATKAPFARNVAQAGHDAIQRQLDPMGLTAASFFDGAERVKALFAQLINCTDPARVAVVPSIAYGMAIVAKNVARRETLRGQPSAARRIVLVEGEFPSDVFAWEPLVRDHGLVIDTVKMPTERPRGPRWNERLLDAIGPTGGPADVALVVVPPVHWMYGIRFDLEAIGQRCRAVGAWFVIDGTQAVGAQPFDWQRVRPDALICAGYKWLMGPYSTGLACFGEAFDDGVPLEESWMNRERSDEFHRLTEYEPRYRPGAYRYNMGESSHFIHLPMLETALQNLLAWQPERITTYCRDLLASALPDWLDMGCYVEPEAGTVGSSAHLLGLWLPAHVDPLHVAPELLARRVSVSVRAGAVRISPHVYNTAADVAALTDALRAVL